MGSTDSLRHKALTTVRVLMLALIATQLLLQASVRYCLNTEHSQGTAANSDAVARARESLRLQNPGATISILEESLKEVPSDFQARIILREAYQLASQPARAQEEFRAALQIHPNHP
jgi:Tfp pilus assembly protein PilF